MATAAVCCPSTVTGGFGHSSTGSLDLPCAGLRCGLSLKGSRSLWQHGCGGRRRRIETRIERSRRGRGGGVRAGLPVISGVPVVGPLANAIFNPVLLFIVYAAGAFRFYSGFRKTTYADSSASKISMTALWPVLFLASKAYRDNFKKAVS